jgi:alcohol dehydrogenase class IV
MARVEEQFTWIDGERLVRFGPSVAEEAPSLLAERGFDGYLLLTTERAQEQWPGLSDGAGDVVHVPAGKVDEISAELLDGVGGRPLVALGGGRVIDTAKALAGAVEGGRSAAVPTTLSGAPMSRSHRMPAGADGARFTRPELVIADPALMASQPEAQLAASAMNALGHATESLYTPLANPVARLAALEAAGLISEGLTGAEIDRPALALASILAGYAVGSTGLAIHHATCQTIVRVTGSPHAETNAVMLPHFARLMAPRAPGALGALAEALGDPVGEAGAAAALIARLAARSGHTRLSTLGVEEGQLPQVVDAVQGHRGLEATPEPRPEPDELLKLLQSAL